MNQMNLKLIAALAAIVVIYLVADVRYFSGTQKGLCGDSHSPPSHTIFLLDFSDQLSDEIAESIKKNILKHQDSSQVGGQLTLLRITPELYKEDHQICKPPKPNVRIKNLRIKNWQCGISLSGINKSSEKDAERYCDFANTANTTLAKINDHAKESLPRSPLIESITEISKRDDFKPGIQRKIILYSDLLQNTNQYSFYRGPLPDVFEVIQDKNIHLDGAEIEIQYIPSIRQSEVHDFWRELFGNLNANATINFLHP